MQPVDSKIASRRKNERGNVLAYTVLSAFFLFMAVGLGVDLSHLYLAKTELQNTADAAALAGASALKLSATEKIPEAVDRAIQIMNSNKYNFNNRIYADVMDPVDQATDLVEFSKNLDGTYKLPADMTAQEKADARFVRVTTPSVPINTFFAIPILGFNKALNAKATAGLSVPGNLSVCPAPLSAVGCQPNDPNCSLCPLDENGVCTETKYWGNCGGANPHDPKVVQVNGPDDPDGNGLCDPKKEFCKTCTYNIRSGPQGGQGPSAGNFQVLRCAGAGANEVKQALALYGTNCQCSPVSPGDEIETQTGELAGAVRAGLNVRFDEYGGGLNYGSTVPPDSNIEQGSSTGTGNNQVWDGISWEQYQGTSTPVIPPRLPSADHRTHMAANRRVLIIPIIPISEFTDETGNQIVRISRLAGFFMRSQVSDGTGGDIQVEYIGDDISGVIGFDPNDNNVTNIVTPVLYR